jgi:hypothetical protein
MTSKRKIVMSDVSSVVKIILRITRDVRSTKTYKKTYPPLRLKQFTLPAQIKQTLHTQTGVTYAQTIKKILMLPQIDLRLKKFDEKHSYRIQVDPPPPSI